MKQMLVKKFRFFLVSAVCFLFRIPVTGQLKIEAQYRPRFEFRDGYRQLLPEGRSPSFIISQRTRLSLSYETNNLRLKFSPQDVRVWGDEDLSSSTGVYGNYASLDLFEGYAEIKVSSSFRISVGRQPFVYDNERLLASRNWNQNGLSYDAVVFKLKHNDWNVHAGLSWNSLEETTSDNLYLSQRIKSLDFLWLNRTYGTGFKFSFLHIASGVTETDTTNTLHFRQTSGIFSEYKSGLFYAKADFYYQYGKNREGATVSAFLADADMALKSGRLIPGAGFSYLSGNKDSGESSDHLFDVLYGARHRFFGHMDYFRDIPSHTKEGGLIDFYGYLNYRVSDKMNLKNTGHFFSLARTNLNTPSNKYLGYENEMEFKYQFNSWGTLKAAWLFYLPTNSFRQLQGVDDEKFPQFVFLEMTLTPVVFGE